MEVLVFLFLASLLDLDLPLSDSSEEGKEDGEEDLEILL